MLLPHGPHRPLGARVVRHAADPEGQEMPQAQPSVTVARPVDEVFAFVADGERGPEWRTGIVDIRHVAGQGMGARYAQGVRGPMGRRIAADYEITAYEPGRRLEFQTIAGPVRPHGRFDFAATEGGTRLTFSLEAELRGLRRLLMGGMVRSTMSEGVQALERLKQVLEAKPRA